MTMRHRIIDEIRSIYQLPSILTDEYIAIAFEDTFLWARLHLSFAVQDFGAALIEALPLRIKTFIKKAKVQP